MVIMARRGRRDFQEIGFGFGAQDLARFEVEPSTPQKAFYLVCRDALANGLRQGGQSGAAD